MKTLLKKIKSVFKKIANFFNYLYKPALVLSSLVICYFLYMYNFRSNELYKRNINIENYKFKEERMKELEENIFKLSSYINSVHSKLDFFVTAECGNPDTFATSFAEGLISQVSSNSSILISKFIFNNDIFTEYYKMFTIYAYFFNINKDIYKQLAFNDFECENMKKIFRDLSSLKKNFETSYRNFGNLILEDKDMKNFSLDRDKNSVIFN